ncbi:hypothetical protein [Paenibacillus arenilitoris]|uniref:Uncharacterized protein n=1 Tax=Paenibacillus arenilitoris TaxID=2772299 RepID=A0A927CR86_9BACL|nr:hypothetical protein [Paenibacillus arenilitoris]MBD2871358.1 hypothetical protein [Paenibacillus arenilitoris]
MRRYGISILIAVLAISGIGGYYAFGSRNHLPEYRLETVQGDPAEGEVIRLMGSQYGDMRSQPLSVTSSGSEYGGQKNRTYRSEMLGLGSWFYHDPDMRQLIDDHKSFMRGKGNERGFYRDDELVIYAESDTKNLGESDQSSVVRLSILRENTGKATKFERTVKEPPDDSQLSVHDVQRVGDEVHVLFSNYKGMGVSMEYVVCIFDIHTGEMLRESILGGWPMNEENKDVHLELVASDRVAAPNDTVFIVAKEYRIDRTGENAGVVGDKLSEKHYAYSYRTGEYAELPEPLWQTAGEAQRAHSVQQEYLYDAEYGPQRVVLSRVDLQTKERENAYATVTAGQLGADINIVQIHGGRVYLTTVDPIGIPGAAVLDLATGELLYKGRIVETGERKQTEQEMIENLHLLNLSIAARSEG